MATTALRKTSLERASGLVRDWLERYMKLSAETARGVATWLASLRQYHQEMEKSAEALSKYSNHPSRFKTSKH
jgi:hypothetical protein